MRRFLILLALFPSLALAATNYVVSSGMWTNPAIWSAGSVPVAGDVVINTNNVAVTNNVLPGNLLAIHWTGGTLSWKFDISGTTARYIGTIALTNMLFDGTATTPSYGLFVTNWSASGCSFYRCSFQSQGTNDFTSYVSGIIPAGTSYSYLIPRNNSFTTIDGATCTNKLFLNSSVDTGTKYVVINNSTLNNSGFRLYLPSTGGSSVISNSTINGSDFGFSNATIRTSSITMAASSLKAVLGSVDMDDSSTITLSSVSGYGTSFAGTTFVTKPRPDQIIITSASKVNDHPLSFAGTSNLCFTIKTCSPGLATAGDAVDIVVTNANLNTNGYSLKATSITNLAGSTISTSNSTVTATTIVSVGTHSSMTSSIRLLGTASSNLTNYYSLVVATNSTATLTNASITANTIASETAGNTVNGNSGTLTISTNSFFNGYGKAMTVRGVPVEFDSGDQLNGKVNIGRKH